MTNYLAQCDGGYRERENDGEEDCLSDLLLLTPENAPTVREPSEWVLSQSRG